MAEATFSCLDRVQTAYQRNSGSYTPLLRARIDTPSRSARAELIVSFILGPYIASPSRSQDRFPILPGTSANNALSYSQCSNPENCWMLGTNKSHPLRQ